MAVSKAKQAELRAALVQELILLFEGASGQTMDSFEDNQCEQAESVELPYCDSDAFCRWYEAVFRKYGGGELKCPFAPWNLCEVTTIGKAADFLMRWQLYPVKK